jgi:quercetin dioxygenase-like cupin family protein
MPFVDTNELDVWERRPGWRGRTFRSDNMSFSHWDFAAGSSIHPHHHPNEEVWYVIAGELEMTVDGVTRRAGPGTVAIVPLDAIHEVRALSDGRALVASHPLREDAPPTR